MILGKMIAGTTKNVNLTSTCSLYIQFAALHHGTKDERREICSTTNGSKVQETEQEDYDGRD